MTFDILHRAVSACTLLIGLAVLTTSGEFSTIAMIGAALAVLIGPMTWRIVERGKRLINYLVVLGGVVGMVMAFYSGDYLLSAIMYVVFLASIRGLALRRASDFMQAYVLSFLMVMAGAVVNPGISFGVLMVPYVVTLTISLLLNTIRRGIEEQARLGAGDESVRVLAAVSRRDLIKPSFLWATGSVTVVVFALSTLFFVFFPRLGLGFFAQQSRKGITLTGFSDTVNLGEFGNVVEDPEVVMRVKLHAGGPQIPLRMRGQSLDQYDGHAWHKTTMYPSELTVDVDGRFRIDRVSSRLNVPDVRVQEIYLEPVTGSPRVLFAEPAPVAFERPKGMLVALRPEKWRFYGDIAGDVTLTGPESTAIVYTVYSDPHINDVMRLRGAGKNYPTWVKTYYLQLPATLDQRIPRLAEEVTRGATDNYEKVIAVESFLKNNYRYELDTVHDPKDPLADFIFEKKSGHCEYFASAMVIMLRTLGIPARLVNGFYGGEANNYGEYVILRKADAHSWVEVFFDGVGFATFDPTPSMALEMRSNLSWLKGISDAIDALKLAWYRWVVEYNLEKQLELMASVLGWSRGGNRVFGGKGVSFSDIRKMRGHLKSLPWGKIGLIVIALIVGSIGVSLLRRKLGRSRYIRLPVLKAYRDATRLLARRGVVRGVSETQLEFAVRVGQVFPRIAREFEELTWYYLEAFLLKRMENNARSNEILKMIRNECNELSKGGL